MNIVTDLNGKVIKCYHNGTYYKYLVELVGNLWALLIYSNDDETQIWSSIYLTRKDAVYAYNHWKPEGEER